MEVELIDWMGTDLTVVNAARVSFDKISDWVSTAEADELRSSDTKLIKYLAKHDHWSPFAHTSVQLHVKAPIFIARQLGKHQVGLVWNEVSRRYVDSEPEFYVPEKWRKRAENAKQGSSEEFAFTEAMLVETGYCPEGGAQYTEFNEIALAVYKEHLANGVCPEQARMVLPQSMYTEWYWTGSLFAFARVVNLRSAPHAQKECRDIAKMIHMHIKELFPVSTEALCPPY